MGTIVLSVVGNSLVASAEGYLPGRRRILVATMYAVIIAALVGIGIIYIPRLTQEGARVIARIQVSASYATTWSIDMSTCFYSLWMVFLAGCLLMTKIKLEVTRELCKCMISKKLALSIVFLFCLSFLPKILVQVFIRNKNFTHIFQLVLCNLHHYCHFTRRNIGNMYLTKCSCSIRQTKILIPSFQRS